MEDQEMKSKLMYETEYNQMQSGYKRKLKKVVTESHFKKLVNDDEVTIKRAELKFRTVV